MAEQVGKRSVWGLVVVVVVSTTLAACGSDKKRLSAGELATQGDAVCAKLKTDVLALADSFPVSVEYTDKQMQEYWTKLVPLLDNALTSFKALEPPKDLEAAYDSAIEQAGIDRKTLEGATASPTAARKLFDTQVDPFTATGQKLAAAGIKGCSSSAGAEPDTGTPTTTAGATPTSAAPINPTTTK